MTNEEAVKMLKAKRKCLILDVSGVYDDCNRKLCNECYLNYEQGNMGQQAEYLRMSIEALEQEPCEDCISRQAVLDCLKATKLKQSKKFDLIIEIRNEVMMLPPVTLKPKSDVLDKIRVEIETLPNANPSYWHCGDMVDREEVFEIIDECMGKHTSGGDTE